MTTPAIDTTAPVDPLILAGPCDLYGSELEHRAEAVRCYRTVLRWPCPAHHRHPGQPCFTPEGGVCGVRVNTAVRSAR